MEIDRPAHHRNVLARDRGATLAEPITIARFWKNRGRNESVHVTLSEYEGCPLIGVRIHSTGSDGIDRPTPKGISMGIRKLPELAAAVAKALATARELGLITGEGGEA
jgi:Transcriptional Coactivator p15 (PC4)